MTTGTMRRTAAGRQVLAVPTELLPPVREQVVLAAPGETRLGPRGDHLDDALDLGVAEERDATDRRGQPSVVGSWQRRALG
ncbi:MAG TPA: hypothetical protein PKU97_03245, partial [Kofleriaceae bacterium]|nr:hypothetical protein [Kofleriaceae bacterium]